MAHRHCQICSPEKYPRRQPTHQERRSACRLREGKHQVYLERTPDGRRQLNEEEWDYRWVRDDRALWNDLLLGDWEGLR